MNMILATHCAFLTQGDVKIERKYYVGIRRKNEVVLQNVVSIMSLLQSELCLPMM